MPIVFDMIGDPVALGLAQSYARPGGLATGVTNNAMGGEEALVGKRMGLLRDLIPGLNRIGLVLPADTQASAEIEAGSQTAGRLGLEVLSHPIRTSDDVANGFAAARGAGISAFYIPSTPFTLIN